MARTQHFIGFRSQIMPLVPWGPNKSVIEPARDFEKHKYKNFENACRCICTSHKRITKKTARALQNTQFHAVAKICLKTGTFFRKSLACFAFWNAWQESIKSAAILWTTLAFSHKLASDWTIVILHTGIKNISQCNTGFTSQGWTSWRLAIPHFCHWSPLTIHLMRHQKT